MIEESESYPILLLNLIIFVLYMFGVFVWSTSLFSGYAIFHKKPTLLHASNGRQYAGVSIIKPLCGVNSLLEENLESHFMLKYPKFELLFCVHTDKDPALRILHKLSKKYPDVAVRYFIGGKPGIVNPMVQNMALGYENSKYDLVWICSARVKVNTEVIYDLVEKAQDPKVAIVSQMPYVADQAGFGNIVEKLCFGGAVAKKYITAFTWGFCCLCGMSYLIKKHLLEDVNGLAYYGKYLSEDQFLAGALHRKGYKLRLSAFPAIQNVGRCRNSLLEHKNRIVRWYRLRIIMMPVLALFIENCYECFPNGLLGSWAVSTLFDIDPYIFFIAHVSFWFGREYILLRIVQNGPLNCSIVTFFCAWLFGEFLRAFIVIEAILAPRTIIWGNKIFKLTFRGLAVLKEDKKSGS